MKIKGLLKNIFILAGTLVLIGAVFIGPAGAYAQSNDGDNNENRGRGNSSRNERWVEENRERDDNAASVFERIQDYFEERRKQQEQQEQKRREEESRQRAEENKATSTAPGHVSTRIPPSATSTQATSTASATTTATTSSDNDESAIVRAISSIGLRSLGSASGSLRGFFAGNTYETGKLGRTETLLLLGSSFIFLMVGSLLVAGKVRMSGWRLYYVKGRNLQLS